MGTAFGVGNNSGCNSKMYFEKVVLSYVRKVCLNKFILAKDYSVKDVVKII